VIFGCDFTLRKKMKKITIESLGLPALAKIIGKKTDFEMPGNTLSDLVAQLAKRHGQPMRKAILDAEGSLDMAIQVMLNDEGFLPRDQYATRTLKDGDKVIFLILVGGG